MTKRHAACSCGQLHLTCTGEPVRISMCHCLACQKRTGSAFSAQARFPKAQVSDITGKSSTYSRIADSGNKVTFHFCPDCGTTLYWELDVAPDLYAVALGAFADPAFPQPKFSVFEQHAHPWTLGARAHVAEENRQQ